MSEVKEWYGNKELFEMIQSLTREMSKLTTDMRETRILIRYYNGLRKDVAGLKDIIVTHIAEERQEEKEEDKQTIKQKGMREQTQLIIAGIAVVISIIGIVISIWS